MSFDAASFPVARQRLPMRRRWLALGASACVLLFSSLALAAESAGKIIGILTFDGILTSEATAPIEVFGKASKEKEFADYRVVTIAPERRPISTAEGLVMLPQYSIDDAPPLDVLIVGGADKMDQVLADPKLALFIRNQGRQVSWLASNCAGASLLGEAGLLAGRRATTYRGGEEAIRKKYGAAIVGTDERVVVDGNLVTSNGGLVSYRAALTLLERMTTGEFAKRIGEGLYYNLLVSAGAANTAPLPSASCGSPMTIASMETSAGELANDAAKARRAAVAGAPMGGNPDGDVTIVQFFDYRCPYCRTMAEALAQLVAEDGHVRVVYREYPILGPTSLLAARAALSAARQGKYESFHHALMTMDGPLQRQTVFRVAEGLGIDPDRLSADMDSREVSTALDDNRKLGAALGVSGTPAFLVGDALISGAVDTPTLKRALATARKSLH